MTSVARAGTSAQTRQSTAIAVRGISKTFTSKLGGRGARVQALRGVDLDVAPGELVVLLGPSGCGKTTLLRSLAGLEKPDVGSISISDHLVYSAEAGIFDGPERRNVGMMFQSYALWPHMSAIRNVMFPLRTRNGMSRKDARVAAGAVLESLGIGDLADRYPSELSGGQAQRVALCRAIAGDPLVLLFDEPLSNVDARVRRQLRAELRSLKQRTGFGGVYVTHDQEEAMELADTLVVMMDGDILQRGTPSEVYDAPGTRFVADLVGEANLLTASVESVAGGTVTVAIAGLVQATLPTAAVGVRAGDVGVAFFRPEDARLRTRGRMDPACVTVGGTVQDSAYRGGYAELGMTLPNGDTIRLKLSTDERESLMPGDSVAVTVPRSCMQWLP